MMFHEMCFVLKTGIGFDVFQSPNSFLIHAETLFFVF